MTLSHLTRRTRHRLIVGYLRTWRESWPRMAWYRWKYRHIHIGFTGWKSVCQCPDWRRGLGLHKQELHRKATGQVLWSGSLNVGDLVEGDS